MPNLSKNAILIGMVDYFCLACETYLKSEKDTVSHIAKPVHQKQLEAIQYVNEFQADCIKKIKNKYFCELCNKLLTVVARVRLHVTEQIHVDNRNYNSLKRVGNIVVAFNKVAICEQSWNSLHKNSCAICDIEYENEEIHKNHSAHILNVLQIQVESDDNKNIYRKIDEVSFHCITCNMVLAFNSLTSHFVQDEHKMQYQACCDAYNKILAELQTSTLQKEQVPDTNAPKEKLDNEKNSSEAVIDTKCEQTLNKIKKMDNEPDFIEEKIPEAIKIDTKCDKNNSEKNKTVNTEQDLIDKTKERVVNIENVANENEDNVIQALGCKDYITTDEYGKTWCILCDWIMDPWPATILNHVNGKHHQTILKLHKARLRKLKNNDNDDGTYNNDAKGTQDNKTVKNIETQIDHTHGDNETQKDAEIKQNIDIKKVNDNISSEQILENLDQLQKEDINVNFEFNTVFCKKCNVHLNFIYKDVESHLLKHKKKSAKKEVKNKNRFELSKTDTKTTLFTSPVLIKQNDEGNKNKKGAENKNETAGETKEVKSKGLFDKAQGAAILKALSSDTQNVTKPSENPNKSNIPTNLEATNNQIQIFSSRGKKPKAVELIRIPLHLFVEEITAVNYIMFKDLMVNKKYCINFFCFCCVVQITPDVLRCQLCGACCHVCQFEEHHSQHSQMMEEMSVILNDDSELIREIKPGSFQCGFCNSVEVSWEKMEVHLKSSSHKESKASATWRKEMYQTNIDRDNTDRLVSDNILIEHLVNRFF